MTSPTRDVHTRPKSAFMNRSARWPLTIAVLCLVAVFIYWAHLFTTYEREREHVGKISLQESQKMAKVVSYRLESLLNNVDFASQHLSHLWKTQPRAIFDQAAHYLIHGTAPIAIHRVGVYDAQGKLQHRIPYRTETIFSGAHDLSGLEEISVNHLHVHRPFEPDAHPSSMIGFSRAIESGTTLQNIIHIDLTTEYVKQILENAAQDQQVQISLLLADGSPLVHAGASHHEYQDSKPNATATQVWERSQRYPLVTQITSYPTRDLASLEQSLHEGLWRQLFLSAFFFIVAMFALLFCYRRGVKSALNLQKYTQLTTLVSHLPGAVFQYQLNKDKTSYFPYVSPGMTQLFGFDTDTFDGQGKTVVERVYAPDRAALRESILESAQSSENWVHDLRVLDRNDNYRWVRARATPEHLPQGGTLWHGYAHDCTSERALTQTLKSQSLQLDLVLDAVRDGIWEYHYDTKEMLWDARIRAMLGYGNDHEKVSSEQLEHLVHPADLLQAERHILQAFQKNPHALFDISLRLRRSDGCWLWTQARGRITEWTNDEKPLRVVGLLHDITERVSQTQLKDALLNRSVATITLVSPSRKLIEANDQFKSMFMDDPTAPVNDFDFRQMHLDEEHWLAFGRKYDDVMRDGQARFDFPMKDRHGTLHWFDMHGVLRDPGNPGSDFIWTWIDVTDKHATQRALTLERMRLKTLLQHFPQGVLIVDEDDRVVFINSQALYLFGLEASLSDQRDTTFTKLADVIGKETYEALVQTRLASEQSDSCGQMQVQTSHGICLSIDYLNVIQKGDHLGAVWFLRDITQEQSETKKLIELASTDSLTGLPNRRYFMQELNKWSLPVQTATANGVILMLDIDHFKSLNDAYGHAMGDQVLTHTAKVLRSCLREHDLPARLGGEEFAVLLPGVELATGEKIAQRIRQRIKDTPLPHKTKQLGITMSIGLSELDMRDAQRSLQRADQALYAAKAQGRDSVMLWYPGLPDPQ